jgi:uncharacterized NAD-dependent epimerase/dehydratase family protein
LILCHEPTRTHLRGLPGYAVPTLQQLSDLVLPLARVANPDVKIVGISVNTQHMGNAEAEAYLAQVEAEMGLPAVDPYRHSADRLADALAAL